MSASSDFQNAIAGLLRRGLAAYTLSLDDWVDSDYSIPHGLGTEAVTVAVYDGATLLVVDEDYSLTIFDENTVIVARLGPEPAPGAWVVTVTATALVIPVLARVSKSLENDIAAAVAKFGITISVMPLMPDHCYEDMPFVFIDRASIRVRIIEKVQVNKHTKDAYQLRDDVMTLMHYRPRSAGDTAAAVLGAMLAYPLTLGNPPAQMMFESGTERVIDVVFNAVFQINAD